MKVILLITIFHLLYINWYEQVTKKFIKRTSPNKETKKKEDKSKNSTWKIDGDIINDGNLSFATIYFSV